jgi:hypothetical protein
MLARTPLARLPSENINGCPEIKSVATVDNGILVSENCALLSHAANNFSVFSPLIRPPLAVGSTIEKIFSLFLPMVYSSSFSIS